MANVAPTITAPESGYVFYENSTGVSLLGLTVSDPDSSTLSGATVKIRSGYQVGADELVGATLGGITMSWNAGSGTLTLTGTASVADYQAALRLIRFNNTSDSPTTGARSLEITLNDGSSTGALSNVPVLIVPMNDAPVLHAIAQTQYLRSSFGVAQAIDPALTINDADSASLTGATVTVSGGYRPGEDVLAFTPGGGISGSFNSATGVLTLTGAASVEAYQAALRSVTYNNIGTLAAPRNISFQATDGGSGGLSAVATVAIIEAAATVLTPSEGAASYVENTPPIVVDPGITLTDDDSATVQQAVVSISSGLQAGDSLGFVNQSGIVGTYSGGTLVLTGTASKADYQAALRSITFQTANDSPTTSRTITFTANDGDVQGPAVTRAINVTPVNDAPTMLMASSITYTEGAPYVLLAISGTIADPDSADFNGGHLAISITANATVDDRLAIRSQGFGAGQIGVSGNTIKYGGVTIATFSGGTAGTDLLIDLGSASKDATQALLRNLTFSNSSELPSDLARSVSVSLTDGDGTSNGGIDTGTALITINVVSVDDPVIVTLSGSPPASTTEGGAAVVIDSGITVADADDTYSESGSVRVATGFTAGDMLNFVNQNGITGSYDTGTGILTLSGHATLDQYRDALRSITFNTTADTSGGVRIVQFRLNDGDIDGPIVSKIVFVDAGDNTAPVLDSASDLTGITEDETTNAGQLVSDLASITDADGPGAGIAVYAQDAGNGTWQYSTDGGGTWTDFGTVDATGALLLASTDMVRFVPDALNGETATISFYAWDTSDGGSSGDKVDVQIRGGVTSFSTASGTASIDVSTVNDAPTLTPTATNLAWTEGDGAVAIDSAMDVSDPDSTTFVGATVQIGNGFQTGVDVLDFVANGSTGDIALGTNYDGVNGTLTLVSAGGASEAEWEAAFQAVTFDNASTNPGSTRTISFVLDDGAAANNLSAAATRIIDVTEVNSAPVVTPTVGDAAFVENSPAVAVDGTLALSDADGTTLVGATVQITTGFLSTQDVLTYTLTGSITTAGYVGATGTIVFTGTGTLAEYQQVLDSVTYDNTSDTPDTTTRTITFQVDDGQALNNLSNVGSRNVTVAATNDAPVIDLVATDMTYTEQAAPTIITSVATVSDVDSTDFNGGNLTVTLTVNKSTADTLGINNEGMTAGLIGVSGANVYYGGALIGTYTVGNNGGPVTVTFTTAAATPAAAEALARNITFSNSADAPSIAPRTVTFSLTDGDGGTQTDTATIVVDLLRVNDAPVISVSTTAFSVAEDGTHNFPNNNITMIDPDGPANSLIMKVTLTVSHGTLSLAGPGALDFVTDGNIGDGTSDATMTFRGTANQIKGALGGMDYVPDANYFGSDTLSITVSDLGNYSDVGDPPLTDSDSVAITVTAVDDAPVNSMPGTQAGTEDAALVMSGANAISISDIDAGASIVQVSLVATGGNMTLSGLVGLTFGAGGNDGTADTTMRFTGTMADINTALNGLTFNPTANLNGNGVASVRIITDDLGGAAADDDTVLINLAAVDDAPANSLPGAQQTNEEATLTMSAGNGNLVSISDIDLGAGDLQVTLTATHGVLTLATTTQLSFTAGDGTADATMTFTGTGTRVNNGLATLRFIPDANYYGPATITVTTSDQGNTGTGGPLVDTDVLNVTVNPINDAPSVVAGGTVGYIENGVPLAIKPAITVSDPEGDGISGATVKITGNLNAAQDVLAFTPSGGITGVYVAGTGTLTLSGGASTAAYQTALASVTYFNSSDNPTTSNRTITFTITDDNANGGANGALTATATTSVTVTAVNDPPSITSSTTVNVAENTATATTVYTAAATDPEGQTITYSITGADAARFTFVAGALKFAAIPNYESPLDSGGNNVYDIVVHANDGTNDTTQALAVTVTDVNEAPTISSGTTASFAENTSAATTVYTITATDPDAGAVITYSITGTDSALFGVGSSSGIVTFNNSPDRETPLDSGGNNVYDIVVHANDGTNDTTKSLAITVTNVNEPPSITSSTTVSVAENTATTTTVYTATATDPDVGATITYSISGTDAARFTITAGAVKFAAIPNYEAPLDSGGDNVYDIVIHANDGSIDVTQAVAITVTNVNEAPTISTGTTASTPENVSTATAVYTIAATDPDAGAVITYSISGTDSAKFNVDSGTGAVTFATSPNFESADDAGANHVYDIVVHANDGTNDTTKSLAITVNNVNEPPSITSSTTVSVAENTATTTTVYTATSTDPDAGATVTYSLTGADVARFTIVAGALKFVAIPNYESPLDSGGDNVYDIVLHANDGTNDTTQAMTVTVTNVNEAPTISSGTTASFAENTSIATTVYTIAATDPDAGAVITYSITGTDSGKFNVDSGTGVVTFISSPNFEAADDAGANHVYDIVVHANDGTNDTTKSLAITVTNVNEPPIITSSTTVSVAENTLTSATIYTATSTDVDAGATVTFTITGTDAAKFTMTTAGVLKFVAFPDFEAPADSNADNVYDLVVHANDGTNDTTQALAVTVTDVLDDPNDFDALVASPYTSGSDANPSPAPNGITYYMGAGGDTFTGKTSGSNNHSTVFGGSGNDTITGTNDIDVIYGGSGNDVISGGPGTINDRIIGGYGTDTLTGSTGADTFAYLSTLDIGDHITDFTSASDKLEFKISGYPIGDSDTTVENVKSGNDATINAAGTELALKTDAGVATASIQTTIDGYSNITTGALFVILNTTTGHAQVWYDPNASVAGGASMVVELDNVTTVGGVGGMTGDFTFV